MEVGSPKIFLPIGLHLFTEVMSQLNICPLFLLPLTPSASPCSCTPPFFSRAYLFLILFPASSLHPVPCLPVFFPPFRHFPCLSLITCHTLLHNVFTHCQTTPTDFIILPCFHTSILYLFRLFLFSWWGFLRKHCCHSNQIMTPKSKGRGFQMGYYWYNSSLFIHIVHAAFDNLLFVKFWITMVM